MCAGNRRAGSDGAAGEAPATGPFWDAGIGAWGMALSEVQRISPLRTRFSAWRAERAHFEPSAPVSRRPRLNASSVKQDVKTRNPRILVGGSQPVLGRSGCHSRAEA
eukprot:scaffold479_cov119-Isochrysis_galbana.AAC.2